MTNQPDAQPGEREKPKSLKWKMLSYTHFETEYEEYKIIVLGCHWDILKHGIVIDRSWYHSPPPNLKDSTTIRVQAERIFWKLLNKPTAQ